MVVIEVEDMAGTQKIQKIWRELRKIWPELRKIWREMQKIWREHRAIFFPRDRRDDPRRHATRHDNDCRRN
jgi:hypothetical protein